ncbi:MAG: hypothetical protein HY301_07910 [Verrucomicrobia bacterium]|nr:hypothetical protein [Verrucomicrobiota bacterium]
MKLRIDSHLLVVAACFLGWCTVSAGTIDLEKAKLKLGMSSRQVEQLAKASLKIAEVVKELEEARDAKRTNDLTQTFAMSESDKKELAALLEDKAKHDKLVNPEAPQIGFEIQPYCLFATIQLNEHGSYQGSFLHFIRVNGRKWRLILTDRWVI